MHARVHQERTGACTPCCRLRCRHLRPMTTCLPGTTHLPGPPQRIASDPCLITNARTHLHVEAMLEHLWRQWAAQQALLHVRGGPPGAHWLQVPLAHAGRDALLHSGAEVRQVGPSALLRAGTRGHEHGLLGPRAGAGGERGWGRGEAWAAGDVRVAACGGAGAGRRGGGEALALKRVGGLLAVA